MIGGIGILVLISPESLPNEKLVFDSTLGCALASNVTVNIIADRRLADNIRATLLNLDLKLRLWVTILPAVIALATTAR